MELLGFGPCDRRDVTNSHETTRFAFDDRAFECCNRPECAARIDIQAPIATVDGSGCNRRATGGDGRCDRGWCNASFGQSSGIDRNTHFRPGQPEDRRAAHAGHNIDAVTDVRRVFVDPSPRGGFADQCELHNGCFGRADAAEFDPRNSRWQLPADGIYVANHPVERLISIGSIIEFSGNDGHAVRTGRTDLLDPVDALDGFFDRLCHCFLDFGRIGTRQRNDGDDRRHRKVRIGRAWNRKKCLNAQRREQKEDNRCQLPALDRKSD